MKKILIFTALACAMALGLTGFVGGHGNAEIARYETFAVTETLIYDLRTESDMLLVNADHPLPQGYEPTGLVNLYEQKGRAFELAQSDISLDKQVFEAMNRMFKQAELDGVDGFIITSGYRSHEKQQRIYAESPAGVAALPGASEHETALAFDVTCQRNGGGFDSTRQFAWLKENCWDYGFILRYPEGARHITGIAYEPWHYRYVGVEAAQAMRDTGNTLEEYLGV